MKKKDVILVVFATKDLFLISEQDGRELFKNVLQSIGLENILFCKKKFPTLKKAANQKKKMLLMQIIHIFTVSVNDR